LSTETGLIREVGLLTTETALSRECYINEYLTRFWSRRWVIYDDLGLFMTINMLMTINKFNSVYVLQIERM